MPCLSYSHCHELPDSPGIYFIGNVDTPVMYVGLSKDLRSRHRNHHRLSQFEDIENAEIRYKVLSKIMIDRIQDLRQVLQRLEKQAISYYSPPINGTSVPDSPVAITSHGPVYIQTHKVGCCGYCTHFDGEDGDELEISTRKLAMATKAIDEARPVFLIASGTYKEYENASYDNLVELKPFKQEQIYVLVSRFMPYGYERVNFQNPDYAVYGATSKIFKDKYIVLNDKPGFSEFKKSYLSLGFINCERSDFAQKLLRLGGIKLLRPA